MTVEPLPDPIIVALEFASHLERLDVPYVVGGSLASSFHGEPRSTHDVDFVVNLQIHQVGALVDCLRPAYYVDPETAGGAVRTGGSFNAIHLDTAVKVDVFIAGNDAFDLERIAHRQSISLGPTEAPATLYLDTPEHTIVRKLDWYRRGDEVSERQWRDVLGIVRTQRTALDLGRMNAWARRLGVADLLERLLREAS